MGPCLVGLYTIVAWLFAALPGRWSRVRVAAWPGKRDLTFSDAITAVRRWLWFEWVLAIPGPREASRKLKPGSRQVLHDGLAPAA
jgi:hypothetical protein